MSHGRLKPLVFMMGRSPVFLPVDRQYARSHYWMASEGESFRLGFSAYAVKLLGIITCLKWSITAGATLKQGQSIGCVEASKATSELYAPISGRVVEVNPRLDTDPTLINSNCYDAGWLALITGEAEDLLSPQEYLAYLEVTWPLAQRLLKGQAGTGA